MKNKERIEKLEMRVATLINRVNILEMKMDALWPPAGNVPPPPPVWAPSKWPNATPYITCSNVKH